MPAAAFFISLRSSSELKPRIAVPVAIISSITGNVLLEARCVAVGPLILLSVLLAICQPVARYVSLSILPGEASGSK